MRITDDALKLAASIVQAAVSTQTSGQSSLNNPETVAALFETVATKIEELRSGRDT